MDKFIKYLLKTILGMLIILLVLYCVFLIDTFVHNKVDSKDYEYYTYAIIFYPDMKTSVEGYVDKFSWGQGIMKVTIDGEEYTTSTENVVIVKRKDLVVNKEDKQNDERNDD